MGLYKLCTHKGRARDRCQHAWWGSFHHRGRLYRESLGRWANEPVLSKTHAQAVYERMVAAVRDGTFDRPAPATLPTFDTFADIYIERHVQFKQLRSADTIEFRLRALRRRFGARPIDAITVDDIEDFVRDLRTAGKKPATINRHLALLRAMLNWAVERDYLDRTPFRRGSQAVIKLDRENNRRYRRLTVDEEQALLQVAPPLLQALIIGALDTGMRRGELLSLRFTDIDAERQVIHVRAEVAKSKKGRDIPIATTRLRAILDGLRLDATGQPKRVDAHVFSNEVGEPTKDFRGAWLKALAQAGIKDLRFHDLRGEYASRLVEHGVPLSQVRDLLGHSSIVTTERYDRQTFKALEAAAKRLDTGEVFKFLSIAGDGPSTTEQTYGLVAVPNSMLVN
jgi:integrase